MRHLIAVILIMGTLTPLRAETAPASAPQPSPAVEAAKAELEQKYADQAREKIAYETTRVEESMDALFWGIASFVTIAAMLGVYALLKTQSQAKELARLASEIEEATAAKSS